MWMSARVAIVALVVAAAVRAAEDAATVMAKVAANFEKATDLRRQYVYKQKTRGNLTRGSELLRKETREYSVIPQASGTEKRLVSLQGEVRKGKKMVPYSEPPKDEDELLGELTNDLVDDKKSRDGIPESLFPLRSKDLPGYKFTAKGEGTFRGRPVIKIGFEPAPHKDFCVHVGKEENDCEHPSWKGEAWIDAEDFQPARIDTSLAEKVPWAVRHMMGTNVHQVGFQITYTRVAQDVWFPETYGTEFSFEALWFYKRTITLSLESGGFQKTQAESTIQFSLP
jgi:hypothetical protein